MSTVQEIVSIALSCTSALGLIGTAYFHHAWRTSVQLNARAAISALTGDSNVVDGVELPDPEDPGWVRRKETWHSVDGTNQGTVQVLCLGEVAVHTQTHDVYVGGLPALKNSFGYGRRVVTAYRQRKARKGQP